MCRSIRLTTALARLGERGLKADIIMRTCFGSQLVRHILLVTGSLWLHHENTRDTAPQQLHAWFDLFDNLQLAEASLLAIISETGTGAPERTQQWLATSAIAHLIDWNLNSLTVTPDWPVLPGGRDATLWVWDRFTATSTDLWRSDSLGWEIAFAEEPENVANVVGLPLSPLRERPASAAMAIRSLRRRLTGQSDAHQILGGLTADEIAQNILGLIQTRNLTDACELARRAWESAPSVFMLANAAAFCLIPTDPSEAARLLSDLKPQNAEHRALVHANLTAAAAVAGAGWQPDDSPPVIPPDFEAFLWDLNTLTSSHPQIKYTNVADWLTQAGPAAGSAPASEQPL